MLQAGGGYVKTVLITLESALRSLDLEVAAELPVRQLLPLLLDASGIASSPPRGPDTVWQLMTQHGATLPSESTLEQCSVFDGAFLVLQDASGWHQPPRAAAVEPVRATPEPAIRSSSGIEVRWRQDDL
jgi:hypothetical protein